MQALWRDLHHLTDTYRGERPLVEFLKAFFKKNHRLGSRDRKMITEALFCWYRAAQGFPEMPAFEETMKAAIRLCGTLDKLSILVGTEDFFSEKPVIERLLTARANGFDIEKLLPSDILFSEGIGREDWLLSILKQPDFFVRLRPSANRKTLLETLHHNGILFTEIAPETLSLPANTPLPTLWPPTAYTVQDWGSQQVCGFLKPQKGESWWDSCAGGGGKSLFLKDSGIPLKLLSSDIRPQALRALENRFKDLGEKPPQTRVADASDSRALASQLGSQRFDAIVCDVPCSGSGTWARTPEMRHFFRKESLPELAALQTRIAHNSAAFLKPGGRLIYMTCSAFRAENEGVVEAVISGNPALSVEEISLQNGISQNADSLFVAVLRKG